MTIVSKIILFPFKKYPIDMYHQFNIMLEEWEGKAYLDYSALAGVAQVECWPVKQRVASSISREDTYLGCGPGPWLEVCARGNQMMFLSPLFLPPFPSLLKK